MEDNETIVEPINNEIIDNGNLECFSIELVSKLLDFANSVV